MHVVCKLILCTGISWGKSAKPVLNIYYSRNFFIKTKNMFYLTHQKCLCRSYWTLQRKNNILQINLYIIVTFYMIINFENLYIYVLFIVYFITPVHLSSTAKFKIVLSRIFDVKILDVFLLIMFITIVIKVSVWEKHCVMLLRCCLWHQLLAVKMIFH